MNQNRPTPTLPADDSATLSFRYEIEEGETPGHALVSVVSAITGMAPTEIDPLGRRIDLDAVDALLSPTGGGASFSPSVMLNAEGLSLAVRPDEIVGVARRDVADWSSERSP